jgi:hypothetical protein
MSQMMEYLCNGFAHTDENTNFIEMYFYEAVQCCEPFYVKTGNHYQEVYDYTKDYDKISTVNKEVTAHRGTKVYMKQQDFRDCKELRESSEFKKYNYRRGYKDQRDLEILAYLKACKEKEGIDYEAVENEIGCLCSNGHFDLTMRELLDILQKFNGTFD